MNLLRMKMPQNITLPNFFIVGAQKAGTTSLYHYLNQHPEIYMSPIKEPGFFALNDVKYNGPGDDQQLRFRTMTEYLTLFGSVTDEKAIGEASTIYLYDQNAPVRIKENVPDAKIIIMLRNPVDRAYSAFYQIFKNGRETTGSFIEALQREDERLADNWGPFYHYKHRGLYYRQIKRYYELFDPENIRIYLFEDFIVDPVSICGDIFKFLNVGASFIPDISLKYNESGYPKSKIIRYLRTFIFKRSRIKSILKRIFPVYSRDKIAKFLIERVLNIGIISPEKIPEEIKNELTGFFEEDILRLQNLIKKDLTEWLKLDR